MARLIVVEGPEIAWRRAVDEAGADGWRLEPGFAPPYRPGRIARTGRVALASDAQAALLAALAGQSIVVHATAERDIIDQLVDDLRRLGSIDHRLDAGAGAPEIDAEVRALLGLIAEGHSLGQAAETLGLSRRTADRRLATGRRLLGTRRTTEAIARATRLGWLPKDANAQR